MASEMAAAILTERRDDGAVAVVTLNRPERHNALNLAMWQGFAATIRELGSDPAVRVVVVRGAGERAFASGADLGELAGHRQTPEGAAAYHTAVEDAFASLAALHQPVIAMIHGYCIGGGCELAIACDLRLADDRARFGIPATKLGIVLGIDELRRLSGLVGPAVAKDILFSARLLDAPEALRTGLVNQVVPPSELEGAVMTLARQIAANAPTAVAAAKQLLDAIGQDRPDEVVARLRERLVERATESGESQERINAFLNRPRETKAREHS